MRLLYVAVTRAQNHVLFLADANAPAAAAAPRTWQNAILFAKQQLQALGPTFVEFA
jgi:ATP-dependent exoDNAse (exonuclease V) beta subunit